MALSPDESMRISTSLYNVEENRKEILGYTPRKRFSLLREIKDSGGDWESTYDHIKAVVDPMDVMTDTQVFGVEIPWNLWR